MHARQNLRLTKCQHRVEEERGGQWHKRGDDGEFSQWKKFLNRNCIPPSTVILLCAKVPVLWSFQSLNGWCIFHLLPLSGPTILIGNVNTTNRVKTRSSWLNCALQDDEAVYWVSIGRYEAVTVGYWWCWGSRGHLSLYILNKVEIWTGVTDPLLTDWLTDFERWSYSAPYKV